LSTDARCRRPQRELGGAKGYPLYFTTEKEE
jgi:hypothetical protein